MFEIEIKKSAKKDLDRLAQKTFLKIDKIILSLKDNPFPLKSKKLKANIHRYRIRTGDFRIIYEVDTQRTLVTIYRVKHRKDAYR